MNRSKPRGLAALLFAAIVALLVWAPGSALADTTVIGEQNLVANMGTDDATGQNVPVLQGGGGADYVLSSPVAGTITSWSFLSGARRNFGSV